MLDPHDNRRMDWVQPRESSSEAVRLQHRDIGDGCEIESSPFADFVCVWHCVTVDDRIVSKTVSGSFQGMISCRGLIYLICFELII